MCSFVPLFNMTEFFRKAPLHCKDEVGQVPHEALPRDRHGRAQKWHTGWYK